jgi:hypothetical protein
LTGLFRAELFEARQKYGLAVQMCRHPALSTWIRHDALEAMRPLLEKVRMGINHHTKTKPARVNYIPFQRITIVSRGSCMSDRPTAGIIAATLRAG